MKKKKLKLFVWTGYCPDYTDGLAFAIAEEADEAMRMIEKERGFEVSVWEELEVHALDKKTAYEVSGGGP